MRHRPRRLLAALAVTLLMGAAASCGDDESTAAGGGATETDSRPAPSETTGTSDASTTTSTMPVRDDAITYEYTIPTGTADRIDAGEEVEVLPERLDVRLGDHITLDNQDDVDHIIGPFFVAANDTLEYTFVSAGSYSGSCSAHSNGEILVVVT